MNLNSSTSQSNSDSLINTNNATYLPSIKSSYNSSSDHLCLINDTAFTIYYNVFNPYSILYSNAPSDFGVTVGLLKFIIHGLCITCMCIFGAIGNMLALFVLSSSQMNGSSTSVFLRCLAISDTIGIVCFTLVVGIPSLLAFNPDGGTDLNSTWLVYNKKIVEYSRIVPSPTVINIGVIGFSSTVLFTMALTMDRYLAVCKPFLTVKYDLCSWKKARRVAVVIFACDILYNLPRFWEYGYVPLETEFDNLTAYIPVPTSLRTNFYYDAYYVHMSYVIGLFLVPVIYLIILNIIICREIHRSNKLRKTLSAAASSSLKSQDISLAYMLFGIVTVFILCQIIPVCHASYRYAVGDVGTESYVPEVELLMCFFFVLNSSVNFLIYCVSGRKFRNAMINVLSCHTGKYETSQKNYSNSAPV